MALYHLTVKVIKRSDGRSAVKSAAYRRGAKLWDERTKCWADYSRKKEVVYSVLSIPQNAPNWLKTFQALEEKSLHRGAEALWQAVEVREKDRLDAQLAREVEFALPLELTREQSIVLARDFIETQFVSRGMVADWSVHADEGNPHVHVLLTMRTLTPEGFGLKCRAWNDKALLQQFRANWAETVNCHLQRAGFAIRVDHRSYADQGIDLVPGVHYGQAVLQMQQRGADTAIFAEANAIRYENLTSILASPHGLWQRLQAQQDTFSEAYIQQALNTYWDHPIPVSQDKASVLSQEAIGVLLEKLTRHASVLRETDLTKALSRTQSTMDQSAFMAHIKQSDLLISLGVGSDGRPRFTTRQMLELESDLAHYAEKLGVKRHQKVSNKRALWQIAQYEKASDKVLTDEQKLAVHYLVQPKALVCLIGRAGTGKGVCLGAAKAVWESQGLKVQGIALSGIAADGLSLDTGMPSFTIDAFRYQLQQKTLSLTKNDVIVMDEAGMCDSVSMRAVLKSVHQAKAKLVLVGDPKQLQPVGPGASFRALVERLGFVELQRVYRQTIPWQRQATMAFSQGNIKEGLAAYADHGCVHLSKTPLEKLLADWQQLSPKDRDKTLVMAHQNVDVKRLNEQLRGIRLQQQEITPGYLVKTQTGEIALSIGDRILLTQNDRALGVTNGRFATIESVKTNAQNDLVDFTIRLSGSEKKVVINPQQYSAFTLGYAATIHKVQGITVDHSLVYSTGWGWNQSLSYVALTRHRKRCHVYADVENLSHLQKMMGRVELKDSVLDFPLGFARRRGIVLQGLSHILPKKLNERLVTFSHRLNERYEQYQNPTVYWKKKARSLEQQAKFEKAKVVADYVDANRAVGERWQAVKETLTALRLDPFSQAAREFLSHNPPEKWYAAQEKRNRLAFDMLQSIEDYTDALAYCGIDLNVLDKQARCHTRLVRVKKYGSLAQKGKGLLSERLAAEILADLKGHYGLIKRFDIQLSELRWAVDRHAKRCITRDLSVQAKRCFETVEAYQKHGKKVGFWVGLLRLEDQIILKSSVDTEGFDEKEKTQPHEKNAYAFTHQDMDVKKSLAKVRQRLTLEQWQAWCWQQIRHHQTARNRYAKMIVSQVALHQVALDFYEIGTIKPEKKQTDHEVQWSHKRWYRLLEHAGCRRRFQSPKNAKTSVTQAFINRHRQSQFAHYSPDEKKWIRLVDRYERINRHIASYTKKLNQNTSVEHHQMTQKIDYYLGRRDVLAAKLLAQKDHLLWQNVIENDTHHVEVLTASKLCFKTLTKQAMAHEKRSKMVEDWRVAMQASQAVLGQLMMPQDSCLLHRYVDWMALQAEVTRLSHSILQKAYLFEIALVSQDLSIAYLQRFENNAQHLKNQVLAWFESQSISTTESALTTEQQRKIRKAQKIAKGTAPIEGTLAEKYLRHHRGIEGEIPKSYRYHPALFHPHSQGHFPALVVIANNAEGMTQAVQAIYLDPETSQKVAIENPKLTYGVLNHGKVGVRLHQGKSDTILVAEGPETALSVYQAYPDATVYASLGVANFARVPVTSDIKNIIFCADNDGEKAASLVMLNKAAETLGKQGLTVSMAMPDEIKQDFNDVLKNEGIDAIKQYVQQAVVLQKGQTSEYLAEKTQEAAQAVLSHEKMSQVIEKLTTHEAAILAAKKMPLHYMTRAKREQKAFIENLVKDTHLMQCLAKVKPELIEKFKLLLQVEKSVVRGR